MTCDQREELLIAYAANALNEAEQEEMRAHLATGCEKCLAALAEAQGLLEQIPATIDPVSPPPGAIKKLMAQVTAGPSQSVIGRFTWKAIAMAACIGIVIGAAGFYFYGQTDREKLLVAMENQKTQLDDLRSMFESEQLKLVALTSPDQSPAKGRVMWDRDNHKWHVVVFDMKPPPPGRTWELWFIKPDQTKIAAGTFDTDSNGRGTTTVDVPASVGDIAVAAITDEPAGGVAQPTGTVHLAGQVQ